MPVGALPAYTVTGQFAAVVNATITSAISPSKPSTLNAGDLLILHVLARNDNSDGAGPASISGWTAFPGNPYGGSNNARTSLYWRIAGAGEASQTVSVTCTGGTTNDLAMARIYRFTAANGFNATAPIAAIASSAGTASPFSMPTVTPTGRNQLAVCIASLASSDTAIGDASGESGGDWTQAVEGASTTGGDGSLQVQTSDQSGGGAISGGSRAFTVSTSAHWVTIGFTLVPADLITSIDTDNDTVDTRTGVAIAGSGFGASETGSAKVEISNNATYGSGTVVEVDVTAWSATSITVTLRRESDSAALATLFSLPLSPAYLWVTDSAGVHNTAGFQFALRAPGPSAMAAVNTTPTIPLSTTKLLRARVENSGGAGSTSFRWAYSLNGGAWTPITTSSDVIRAVAASTFANDDDVPGVLGAVSLSDNNAATEDGTTTLAANFPASGNQEFVLAFQRLDPGPIQIRLELGDGTAFTTYTNTPNIASLGDIVTLDTAAIVGAGSDLLASVRPTLDTAAAVAAGNDLTSLEARTVALDTASVAVAGTDLTANIQPTIDTAAIVVAGSDLTILEARTVTLDTGAIMAAGSDLAANQAVTLDTDDIALAGADITVLAASTLELETAAIAVVGADLTILAPSTLELDTGAISVAGTDVDPEATIVLDTGAATASGSDLAAQALVVTLDTAAASLTGADLAILAAGAVQLDIGAVAASGADLAANQAVALDAGAITGAGSDLVVLRSQLLDTGAATVAGIDLAALHMLVPLDAAAIALEGEDIIPLAAGDVLLDTAAITVAGQDAAVASAISLDTGAVASAGADLQQHAVVALDIGSVASEGADVAPILAIALDDAAIVVAGQDLTLSYTALLDVANVGLVANDIQIFQGELGVFGPRQEFDAVWAAPQTFGGSFGAGVSGTLIFGAPQGFNATFASGSQQTVVFDPAQSFEVAA